SATGYGAGDKDFPEHANVLRVLIGETQQASEATTISVIETNIDDTTPEIIGYAMERLIEAGALDVTVTPLVMKKSRPGSLLSVLARPEDVEKLASIVLSETTTLGVRISTAERRIQSRESVEIGTAHGKVRIKRAASGSFAPEYEDCRRLALELGLPLKEIVTEATFAYLKQNR
ncbi:MAG TPA: LarC family nickel insertion protein, partial [Bryobacteraceae bacterium]|nr:LarC family nickel insertion protein [Bryobacteraceae bacterium]